LQGSVSRSGVFDEEIFGIAVGAPGGSQKIVIRLDGRATDFSAKQPNANRMARFVVKLRISVHQPRQQGALETALTFIQKEAKRPWGGPAASTNKW
jgi:hypothetical protein